MIKHQDKPEEKLEQKLNILQRLVHVGFTPFMKFGEFMSNVQNKSTEEARKGTYIFSELFKNASESYLRTEEKYRSSLNPFRILEVNTKGMYWGGITDLVMIEYGVRQLKK